MPNNSHALRQPIAASGTSIPGNAQPLLMDIKAVCGLLCTTRSRVYELLRTRDSGFPKPSKLGRSTRWHYSDLVAWANGIREQVAQPAPPPRAANVYSRARHFKPVFNTETGTFDWILKWDRLIKTAGHPPLPRVPSRRTRVDRRPSSIQGAALPKVRSTIKTRRTPENQDLEGKGQKLREQYEAGATVDALVSWHHMGKAKVLQLLHEAGSAMRKPGPKRKAQHIWPSSVSSDQRNSKKPNQTASLKRS
jgi:predicted DNA-binding transcriptional regulator AlpA